MILLRHGQSHFNVHYVATRQDPGIVDPGLTEDGVAQVEDAAAQLEGRGLRRILVSPYSRTLETAEIVAQRLGLEVTINILVRERAYFTCDIGTPRSELAARWPGLHFGELDEQWWPERESEAELAVRCERFHGAAAGMDDWSEVLVVTHWGFIRGLTGQEVPNAAIVGFQPNIQAAPVAS